MFLLSWIRDLFVRNGRGEMGYKKSTVNSVMVRSVLNIIFW